MKARAQTPNDSLVQWRRGAVAGGADPALLCHLVQTGVTAAGYSRRADSPAHFSNGE